MGTLRPPRPDELFAVISDIIPGDRIRIPYHVSTPTLHVVDVRRAEDPAVIIVAYTMEGDGHVSVSYYEPDAPIYRLHRLTPLEALFDAMIEGTT